MNYDNIDDLPDNSLHGEPDLQLENELLKLKMQAELGAQFGSFPGSPEISPELERQFLEQVLAFERSAAACVPVPVREYLGFPVFRPAAELGETELQQEWARLVALYDSRELSMTFLAEYPLALKYDFLAGEFLDHEVDPMPGWCYIYEEFHPNHDFDLRERTEDFMKCFFRGQLAEFVLSDPLVTDAEQSISLDEAQHLLERFHGMFTGLADWQFRIESTSAQTNEELAGHRENMPRLGFAEGHVRYTVTHEDGTRQEIEGPFKLNMECRYGCWSVIQFSIHGFSW